MGSFFFDFTKVKLRAGRKHALLNVYLLIREGLGVIMLLYFFSLKR